MSFLMSTLGLHRVNIFPRKMCKGTQRGEEGPRVDLVGREENYVCYFYQCAEGQYNSPKADRVLPNRRCFQESPWR